MYTLILKPGVMHLSEQKSTVQYVTEQNSFSRQEHVGTCWHVLSPSKDCLQTVFSVVTEQSALVPQGTWKNHCTEKVSNILSYLAF